jgi:hypothetical protein
MPPDRAPIDLAAGPKASASRRAVWWAWLVTLVALAAGGAGFAPGIAVALASVALQAAWLARARGATTLAVQVRLLYLVLLALGCWTPLRPLHGTQIAGTAVLLVFDYCCLARVLSLLPWNRREPLTLARLHATFFTAPVRGNIADALARQGAEASGTANS